MGSVSGGFAHPAAECVRGCAAAATRCAPLLLLPHLTRDLIDGTDKIIDISTKCHSILDSILAIQVSASE